MNQKDIINMAHEASPDMTWYAAIDDPTTASPEELNFLKRFAALVAAAEREAIMDEWWMCVQSDLENGVKSLNERAAEKWKKEYPEISKFAETIRARGETK